MIQGDVKMASLGARRYTADDWPIARKRSIDMSVGAQLAARRSALHLSQDELAAYAGVSAADITAHERGETRISPAVLLRLSKVLGVRLRFFFETVNEP